MQLTFDKRLFTYLTIAFIISTIAGTLTHEGGHYAVAEYLGYDAHINYMASWYRNAEQSAFLDSIYKEHKQEIIAKEDFPGKDKYLQVIDKYRKDGFWIGLGGPLETMLTGSLGLILLFFFRKSFENATILTVRQWLLIFLSLFWLRQTANLVVWIGDYLLTGRFSLRGDEIKLAFFTHLPMGTIATATAIIGAIVLALIIFKFVPINQRLTFIASGLTGGIVGYIFWLVLFGKYIMP